MNEEQMKAEREAFEVWGEALFFSSCFEREDGGEYAGRGLQGAWLGWKARAALHATPAPSGEVEAVEVVGWQYRVSAGPATGWSPWFDGKGEQYELSYQVERRAVMTVAQHQRLLAAKDAEIARLKSQVQPLAIGADQAMTERDELRAKLAAQSAAVPSEALQLLITAALYDFGGWLTTRDKRMFVSATDDAGPMAEAVSEFCGMRNLDPNQAVPVLSWQEWLSTPAAPQQGDLVRDLVAIIDEELLPNIGHLAIQDYARLNDTLVRARLNADRSAQGEKP